MFTSQDYSNGNGPQKLGAVSFPMIGRSLGFGNFAGLDATGADADALAGAVHNGLHSLQVYVPAAAGNVVRVRNVVAELRSLAAKLTGLCHDKSPGRLPTIRLDEGVFAQWEGVSPRFGPPGHQNGAAGLLRKLKNTVF